MPYRLGVDIGGTFTDLIVLNERTGETYNYKVPSMPRQPEQGFLEALRRFLKEKHVPPRQIKSIVHATTVATNAIIGQTGLELPKTGLITTEGFRDVLEIGRQNRPEMYNFFFQRPKPLVSRQLRLGVRERVTYQGAILDPLQRKDVEKAVQKLRGEGAISAAVCLLHSYANPAHEELVGKVFKESFPECSLSLSHQILPEMREYERTSTTVLNALLMPVISRYLAELQSQLHKEGVQCSLYVMQSNGGMASERVIRSIPARAIESGPAAGVIAASFLGEQLAERSVLSFDMGGTTAKAGLIRNGQIQVTTSYEVGGRIHGGHIVRGSGYPVRFPFVDLAEIGAGGGSVAWLDAAAQLHVGPRSAGADPGPACYGLGGMEPTVTDAHVVLGQLNSKYLLGGDLAVHPDKAREAFKQICDSTRMNLQEAALGVLQIADSHISKLLRIMTVERGFDPRNFLLVVFGGCGPMHACVVARELGITKLLIPPSAGLVSALGLLITDFIHDSVQTHLARPEQVDPEALELLFRQMEGRGRALLLEEGVTEENILQIRAFDMRYVGQSYELDVNVEGGSLGAETLQHAVASFHGKHETLYGFSRESEQVEIVNLRVRSVGVTSKPDLKHEEKESKDSSGALKEEREVTFSTGVVSDCRVYDRGLLRPGNTVDGPAILEDFDSTTVLPIGSQCTVDRLRNLIVELS